MQHGMQLRYRPLFSHATAVGIAIAAASGLLALALLPPPRVLFRIGQVTAEPDAHVFHPEATADGVIVGAGDHNFLTTDGTGTFPLFQSQIQAQSYAALRFWVYEYTGTEPPFTGTFFIDPVSIAEQPDLAPLSTLTEFTRGKWYYVQTNCDLFFKAGEGLELLPTTPCAFTNNSSHSS